MDLDAVELFNKLVGYRSDLEGSNCDNLRTYVENTTVFWFDLIKDKLKMYELKERKNTVIFFRHTIKLSLIHREMQDTLKLLQWPLISTNQEVLKTVPPPDLMTKFHLLFQCLTKLKIPANQ